MSIPKRTLGKTGEELAILGFGGLLVDKVDQYTADRLVNYAIDSGINHFDVAPMYGMAESRMGPAIESHRDRIFLSCKTHKRDKKNAKEDFENSLKELRTDHIDLYQLHGLVETKEVEKALSKDGAIELALEAKKAGKIKYIGFSAHTPEAAVKAMNEFDFDTVMYPVNFGLHFNNRWEVDVLSEAKKRNMGIIALKALALQKWPEGSEQKKNFPKTWYQPITDEKLQKMAMSWTLSQGVSVALTPGDEHIFKKMVEYIQYVKDLSPEDLDILESLAENITPIFPD